jgi:tetratricopeptide (TPR) repeat protein
MNEDSRKDRSLLHDPPTSAMEEIRRRFEAAWEAARHGQAPPDLEQYLTQLPEPERSKLRSVLESVVLAYRRHAPGSADPVQPAADGAGGTIDPPPTAPPGGETLEEKPSSPGGVPGNEAPAAAVGETIDEPALLRRVDAAGATTAGDPGTVPVTVPARPGGTGVVYKARQRGLNRLVALKMILAGEHAGEQELTRFKTEAEAVARLQHPNIVQIYEVGEEEGRPYFSLEFVEGGSLDRKLHGTPQSPQEAARLLHQLAVAMQAAHEKNIIHRDLKPANVLLTTDGTPKITDFGLAKRLEEDAGQTHSGAILGTPSYMSPEQADGNTQAIGPLSDVYSLGAILYESLTGRVPFRSPTILETLQQVKTREPVAPTQLQPKVPRDLETICLKCLQKDPKKRYVSAGALAEDLRRFLNHEPILARPVGRVERTWRWCQRNPLGAFVILMIVVWAASMTGLAFALKWQKDATEAQRVIAVQQRDAADQARKAEKAARQDAEHKTELARNNTAEFFNLGAQLVEELFKLLQNKHLAQNANADLRSLRATLLRILGDKMATMAGKLEDSGATPFAQLSSHQHFGDMLKRLGRYEEAMQRFQKGTELARKLAAEHPNSDKAQGNLSVMIKRLGDMELELRSDPEAARRHYREALRLAQDVLDHPRNHDMTEEELPIFLSHPEMSLGQVELVLGHPADARKHLVRALELRRKWLSYSPNGDSQNSYLAEAWMWCGVAAWHEGDEASTREAFARATGLCEKLIAKHPQAYWYKEDLADIQGHQGDAWLHLGKLAEAKKSYAESLKNVQAALAQRPEEVGYRLVLALTEERLGALARAEGKQEEAVKHYRAALFERRALLKLDPNQRPLQFAYVRMQAHCGQEASAAANAAVLLKQNPKSPLLLLDAARCFATCAAMTTTPEVRQARLVQAVDAVRTALAGGYKDRMVLRTDPDLAVLQKESAYQALLAPLAKR